MKRLLTIITAIVIAITSFADNRIYIEDTTLPLGSDITLPIFMENGNSVTAFQFDLTLPEGITLKESLSLNNTPEKDGITLNADRTPGSTHSLSYSKTADGVYHVICYSINLNAFNGTEGVIANIRINAPSNAGSYQISLSNIEMTEMNMNMISCNPCTANLTLTKIHIAEGTVGTCHWYITIDDGMLVIEPANGVSGDLPTDGWAYTTSNNIRITTAPWGEYRDNILSAKIMSGVNATSCSNMFCGLSKMTEIDLSNFNTQDVTTMWGMFQGCASLTSLDLSNFNTENVESMYEMFSGCLSLTSLDLSSFNTTKAKSMCSIFSACSSLKSLNISSFNTDNVVDMSWMFSGCLALTSLDLSNFNTANVTEMQRMFYGCYSLTSLNLSNFNTANVTNMSWMFSGCSELSTIISNNSTPSPLKAGTFSGSFEKRAYCTLFVPSEAKTLYAAADGWNELGIIMQDITIIANGKVGTCTWYITKDEGMLVIEPANGISGDLPEWNIEHGDSVIASKSMWRRYSENISSAKIMSGVNAHVSCSYLFATLNNIKEIDLSGLNTTNVTDMRGMFSGCSSLTSLDLSNFNTTNVKDMGGMFYECSALTSLNLSNFNTEKVTTMSAMFAGCTALTSLDLSNFNTKNVMSLNGIFQGCSALKSLNLSNFNTQNVGDMSAMFNVCYALTSLDLSNFNTANVSDMSAMFAGCTALTSLDLSNFNTKNVRFLDGIFRGCSALKNLNLTNFNMSNVTYMRGMFEGCTNLTTITSNNTIPSPLKVGTFSDSFEDRANCTLLVPKGTKALYAAADGWNELGKIKEDIETIAEGTEGTCHWYITKDEGMLVIEPTIGASGDLPTGGWTWKSEQGSIYTSAPWGEYHESILSAKIMPGVNVKSCKYMFHGLSQMKTIDISNLNTANVSSMLSMFDGCSSLTSLDLSNFNTANVTDMMNMFNGCKSLSSINISGINTAKVTSMRNMFYDCSSLTSIDLSSFNTERVTDMSWMFHGCASLTSLDIKYLNTAIVNNMRGMFSGCSSLTSLDLSSFNTTSVENMNGMFNRCSALTSLALSSFNTEKVTDMSSMFAECTAITSLDLSNLNTANVTKMSNLFDGCSSLTSLDLSNFNTTNASVYSMFTGCHQLTTIITNNTTPSPLKIGTFTESFTYRSKCTLVVPFGTKALYAAADGWKELGKIWYGYDDVFDLENISYEVTSENQKTVNVTGIVDKTVNEIIVPAEVQNSGITYNVATIADNAFADCTNLLEVTFEGAISIPADIFGADAVERNLFVYAPAGSTSEYKGNVVIGGVAENVILHDAKPLRLSQEFTANKVSYSREFSKQTYPNEAGGWETIVLPFDVKQIVSEKGDVLTPFRSGVEDSKHFWLAGLTSNGFGRASVISANIPYIISMPNSPEYYDDYNITGVVTFSAENATMHKTMDATTYTGNAFKLVPAYEGAEASVDVYAINDADVSVHHAGALFVSNSRAVRPFEAYAAAISGSARPIFFTIGSDDATGITDIDASADTHNMMYDLSGRRVNGQQKGIVIMRNANGKYSKKYNK